MLAPSAPEQQWLNRHVGPEFEIIQTYFRESADVVLPEEGENLGVRQLMGIVAVAMAEKFWFLQPEYQGKRPAEQWTLHIGAHDVQLYNYVPWRPLSEEHVDTIAYALASFESIFPGSVQRLQSITAVNHLKRSPYGDPKKYPPHAEAQPRAGMFALQGPQALALRDHYRNQLVTNSLSAVVVHEMTHLIRLDSVLAADFQEAGFTWDPQLTAVMRQQRRVNGNLLFQAEQPESCVTDYGVLSPEEDACESVAAYIFLEPTLDAIKERIIERYDQEGPVPTHKVSREQEPNYPLLPKQLSYYLDPTLVN